MKPKFKNKWKFYSHIQRVQNYPANLVGFKSFLTITDGQPIELQTIPFTSPQQKTTAHWQLAIDVQKLSTNSQSLLSKQMREFVASSDSETIYNKMIQTRWELARLVEMVQVENFRYEFLRTSLQLRNIKPNPENRRMRETIRNIENHYDSRQGKIREVAMKMKEREVVKIEKRNEVDSVLERLRMTLENCKNTSKVQE